MLILHYNDYSLSDINVLPPIPASGGHLFRFTYKHALDFVIQLPLCKVKNIVTDYDKPYVELSFPIKGNFKAFQMLGVLFNMCIETIQTYRTSTSVYKDVRGYTDDVVESHFTFGDATEDGKKCIRVKLHKNTKFFDLQKKEILCFDVKTGDTVVALIKTRGLFADTQGANLAWNAHQILKYHSLKHTDPKDKDDGHQGN